MTAAVLLQLIAVGGPLVVTLIQDAAALFKAHPQLDPNQVAQMITLIHSVNADTAATVDADQAAHPAPPPIPAS